MSVNMYVSVQMYIHAYIINDAENKPMKIRVIFSIALTGKNIQRFLIKITTSKEVKYASSFF